MCQDTVYEQVFPGETVRFNNNIFRNLHEWLGINLVRFRYILKRFSNGDVLKKEVFPSNLWSKVCFRLWAYSFTIIENEYKYFPRAYKFFDFFRTLFHKNHQLKMDVEADTRDVL